MGTSTADDAGVYKINEDLALVQTVDYFTPVVDDPFVFGQITAANALSDIYAMGAVPATVLNIVAFPTKSVPMEKLAQILAGGADKVKEAGAVIIGGHSISDQEPKYGMAVTAFIHPDKVITNAGANVGDKLILTKPLGLGIIATAIKRGKASEELSAEAVRVMTELNRLSSQVMVEVGVNSCTDITGFGLLGHLWEMTRASGVKANIYPEKIPVIEGTRELLQQGVCPGGTKKNLSYVEQAVVNPGQWEEGERLLLADAQTSGGLLISVPSEKSGELMEKLTDKGSKAAIIGEISEKGKGEITLKK
ncbi:selenide,water dikinase [Desulfitispora alkaliphila]